MFIHTGRSTGRGEVPKYILCVFYKLAVDVAKEFIHFEKSLHYALFLNVLLWEMY